MSQLTRYESYITQLSRQTLFWPPIRLARYAANKWTITSHLQMIARLQGSYTPSTTILTPGHDIPANTVLKRTHSECGQHVILPTDRKLHRTWEYLNARTGKDELWMAQEYVESLAQMGEWRAFIIGGKVISVMHTHKVSDGDWLGACTNSYLSLDEIRRVVFVISIHQIKFANFELWTI